MQNITEKPVSDLLIYGLCDPISNELRYIGLSTTGEKRPKEHLNASANQYKTHKCSWVKSLFKKGLKPEIFIVEEHTNLHDLSDAEDFWIQYFRSIGCRLTNMKEGGYGGKPSEEVREKQRAAHRNRSPEASASRSKKISDSRKGKSPPTETRDKISNTLKGRKVPAEVLEKRSKTLTGRDRTPAFYASMEKYYEKLWSQEHYVSPRKKIREKLNIDIVNQIRADYIPYKFGRYKLAKKYGVSDGVIRNILHGKTWRW